MSERSEGALPPVIEFVERVAQATGREALSQWVTKWSMRQSGGAQPAFDLRERLKREAAATDEYAILYVDVSRASAPSPPLGPHLRYWVYGPAYDLLGSGNVSCPPQPKKTGEASIRSAMVDVLQEAVALLEQANETAQFRVELFVTLEQLGWDFEDWRIRLDDEESPSLGIIYPLTLRWVERARSESSALPRERRNTWRVVTRRIRDRAARGDAPKVMWLPRDGSKPLVVEATLSTQDYGTFVALEFVPAFDATHDLERKLMRAVLYGGAPFVVWRRRAPADWPTLKDGLRDLLDHAPFDDLPQRCVPLRVAAVDDTAAPGHSLAVLWDDPDRNPLAAHLSHHLQRQP
jgi:hypothetical protein